MESLKRIGRDLQTELTRIVTLISDEKRLHTEFIGETWGLSATFRDFRDAFYRVECDAKQRIERSRYVAIVEDVQNAVVRLRFAVRDGKANAIKAECAIIRRALRMLNEVLGDRYTPEIQGIPESQEFLLNSAGRVL